MPNSSAQAQAIQARPLPTPVRFIGMDFVKPWAIYVDGAEFSTFPTIEAAEAVYTQLRAKLRHPVCEVQ